LGVVIEVLDRTIMIKDQMGSLVNSVNLVVDRSFHTRVVMANAAIKRLKDFAAPLKQLDVEMENLSKMSEKVFSKFKALLSKMDSKFKVIFSDESD
jgi:hypothetical protein